MESRARTDGAQVLSHGGAGVCSGPGFDGVQDEAVLDVGGVLAVGHHVEGFGLVGEGVADIRHDAFEHLVAAGAGDGCMEAGIEGDPGFWIGLRSHGRHHAAEDFQVLGGAALGGEAGGGDFDVRPGLGEVPGGELAQDEIVGHMVGDDERAAAGLGYGQAEGGAGTQGLADHRAADAVLRGQRCFGAELGANTQRPALDVAADGVEDSFGCAEAGQRKGGSLRFAVRLSGCLTGSRLKIWHGSQAGVNRKLEGVWTLRSGRRENTSLVGTFVPIWVLCARGRRA